MDKDVGKISKGEFQGSLTEIVIGIKEYNGKVGVDIREFVSGEKYTGPTKKGLRIPAADFPKFKEIINSINQADLIASPGTDAPAKTKPQTKSQESLPDY